MDCTKRNAFKAFGALGLTAAVSPIVKSHTTGEAPFSKVYFTRHIDAEHLITIDRD